MEIAVLSLCLLVCIVAIAVLVVRRPKPPEGPSPAEIEARVRQEAAADREAALSRQERYFASLLAETESRFRSVAQKVLDERSEKLKSEGLEQLGSVVAPLAKDIRSFREKMELVNEAAIKRGGKLEERIGALAERTALVSSQADELARAIRGESQVTGEWAEIQLRRVMELSGLVEGVDYTYQETFASDESLRRDLRTDVVVKVSDDKYLVIDSKNTVDSYVEYVSSEGEDREAQRRRIVESLRGHVDELKSAAYQRNIKQAFDFVFMYIPFEEVYLIAMKAELRIGRDRVLLREYARRNGVVFVNATSLLPTLRLVAMTWAKQDSDAKAAKIKEECAALCKKFETFLATYERIGKSLAKAMDVYGEGLGQLASGRGNIIRRVRGFKDLDVPAAVEIRDDESFEAEGQKCLEGRASARTECEFSSGQ